MRTNIDIDDDVMAAALRAGPYSTKREAVEAGLRLVARQAAYREILRWEGQLRWDDHDSPEAGPAAALHTASAAAPAPLQVQEPAPRKRHAGR